MSNQKSLFFENHEDIEFYSILYLKIYSTGNEILSLVISDSLTVQKARTVQHLFECFDTFFQINKRKV